jgi:hypothetical protein
MMILLLLFLQKQSLAFAVYLFGIADQLKTQVITGSQSQGAEHTQQNALILSDIRQQAGVKPSSKKGAKTVLSLNRYLHQWILRMFSARSRMPVVSS